uniref:Amine oxidase n=1 Tax=Plectus sambesii TaxID=2011161 RepID=A0A914VWL7_9BILA
MLELVRATIVMALLILPAAKGQVQNFDVVIIGGGISGLTAAYTLKKANPGISLVVLEARDRIGGRAWSVDMRTSTNGGTDRFDLGGQWIGASQTSIVNLLAELGIDTYAQRVDGSRVDHMISNASPEFYTSNGTDFSEEELTGFSRIESMLLDDPLNGTYDDRRNVYWNRTNVADALLLMRIPEQAAEAVKSLIRFTFDTTPENMSMLHFLMFLRSAGNRLDTIIAESGDSSRSSRISGGAQSLVDRLAQNVDIRLNQQVCRVVIQGNSVTVGTYQGNAYTTSFVIMAVPPVLASEINFSPPLSFEKRNLLVNFAPKSTGIKFVATYPSAFWRDQNLSGNVMVIDTTMNAPISSLVTSDATTALNAAALEGIVESRRDLDNATRRSAVLDALALLIGSNATTPIDYREMTWANELMSRGCMASLAPSQVPSNYADLIRAPTSQRIMWAGTETSTEWMGFMTGAVQAGQRAANEVVMQSSQIIRNDNVISNNQNIPTTTPGLYWTTQTISYNNGLNGNGQTTGIGNVNSGNPFPTPLQNFPPMTDQNLASSTTGPSGGQGFLSSVLDFFAGLLKAVTDQLETPTNQPTTGGLNGASKRYR